MKNILTFITLAIALSAPINAQAYGVTVVCQNEWTGALSEHHNRCPMGYTLVGYR